MSQSSAGDENLHGAAVPGRRLALVLAVTDYVDPSLRRLRAPAGDAADLRDLLADAELGGFAVTSVINEKAQQVRLAIEDFLADRRTEDVLLLYLSCHGLMDPRRRLYFAARDTIKNRLASSGVESTWVLDQLEDCRARRQVVILDCCFSGAFAQRSKGADDIGLGERLVGDGRGRVVLTASRGSEYSFEGQPLQGEDEPRGSVFTSALIEGIRSGRADADGDGRVSVDEAYAYAFDRVRESGNQQTPQRWLYGAEGSILLARVPTAEPRPDQLAPVSSAARSASTSEPTAPRGSRRALFGGTRRVLAHPRWRVAVLAAAAGTVLAGTAVAVALRHDGSGRDGLFPDDDPLTGTVKASSPWRLQVDDHTQEVEGTAKGCDVELTKEGQTAKTWSGLYAITSWQVHDTGTFRYTTSSAGCILKYLHGGGDVHLDDGYPWNADVGGDTNSFDHPGSLTVTVTDLRDQSPCDLTLWSVEKGAPIGFGSASRVGEKVRFKVDDPGEVYFARPTCSLLIEKG